MRHHWVRDIADFAKYGLLKRLAGGDLRLGVLWYLTTHGARNKPLVTYLAKPDRYSPCDAELFLTLRHLHETKGDSLTLDDIERSAVLPADAVFYNVPLSTTSVARPTRRAVRHKWFEAGIAVTSSCDVVFLDPDTGLLPPNRKAQNAGGEEYATVDEIRALRDRDQSVICVQFGVPGNFEAEPVLARQRLAFLRKEIGTKDSEAWGLWWRDRHKVGLLVAPSPRHASVLRSRTAAILEDPAWNEMVSLL